jgi:hypothetical protein
MAFSFGPSAFLSKRKTSIDKMYALADKLHKVLIFFKLQSNDHQPEQDYESFFPACIGQTATLGKKGMSFAGQFPQMSLSGLNPKRSGSMVNHSSK